MLLVSSSGQQCRPSKVKHDTHLIDVKLIWGLRVWLCDRYSGRVWHRGLIDLFLCNGLVRNSTSNFQLPQSRFKVPFLALGKSAKLLLSERGLVSIQDFLLLLQLLMHFIIAMLWSRVESPALRLVSSQVWIVVIEEAGSYLS
jgi:hypothetical protein